MEVFFRFIKQELNFSHFMSVNGKGIKITLYMTLIFAMPIMIYRRLNQTGYKTAKRRFATEPDEMTVRLTVIFYGGNPDPVFNTG
jgi:hypothetical protein